VLSSCAVLPWPQEHLCPIHQEPVDNIGGLVATVSLCGTAVLWEGEPVPHLRVPSDHGHSSTFVLISQLAPLRRQAIPPRFEKDGASWPDLCENNRISRYGAKCCEITSAR
jgi:hypothetical protein